MKWCTIKRKLIVFFLKPQDYELMWKNYERKQYIRGRNNFKEISLKYKREKEKIFDLSDMD